MRRTVSITLFAASIILSSCVVSKKKYDELNARKSELEVEKANCDEHVKALMQDSIDLSNALVKKTKENEALVVDTAKLGYQLNEIREELKQLQDVSNKDAKLLSQQLSKVGKLNQELDKKEKELAEKNAQLQKDQEEIEKLQQGLEAREQRVKELENMMSEQEKSVNKLKSKISEALLSFNDDELTVELKDGKVYVSLAEQLLFQSGKYDVDQKGIGALDKLAKALKDQKDIDIIVEGHTDDVPMNAPGPISDNWDLSVKRATSIVKVLTKAGLDPTHVTAAGRAEFSPKVEGKTKEARAKNRRTEIIISPNLDELFKLLEK